MAGLIASLVERYERWKILREIEMSSRREEEALAFDDKNLVNLAKIALNVDDPDSARRYWQEAMVRYPRFASNHKDALDIMIQLGLVEEAEAIAKQGMKSHPSMATFAGSFARVAEEQKHWPEALKRWDFVRKHHPSWWKGHVHYARMLFETGDGEAADKVLSAAVAQFSDEVIVKLEWARSADRRQLPEVALKRWSEVWEQSKHPAADTGIAKAMLALGRTAEAEARLREAIARTPLVEEMRIILANIVAQQGRYDEALEFWIDLKQRMPRARFGYEGHLRLLRDLGRFDEAEAVIRESEGRFPNENWPNLELETLNQVRSQRAAQKSSA